jgi:hypothetical protein
MLFVLTLSIHRGLRDDLKRISFRIHPLATSTVPRASRRFNSAVSPPSFPYTPSYRPGSLIHFCHHLLFHFDGFRPLDGMVASDTTPPQPPKLLCMTRLVSFPILFGLDVRPPL